jgi:hypothetical protein
MFVSANRISRIRAVSCRAFWLEFSRTVVVAVSEIHSGQRIYRKFTLIPHCGIELSGEAGGIALPESRFKRHGLMIRMRTSGLALAGMVISLGMLSSGAGLAEQVAAPESIAVTLDQAKLVKLPAGAETIVIGNPAIADVTVQKNGVMVITGRATGRTNFIALDTNGVIISESILSVSVATAGKLIVQRGLERNTYDCSPTCLPTVSLGDEDKHFALSVNQSGQRDGMARQNGTAVTTKK